MKNAIAILMTLALVIGSGCWLNNKKDSPQGGVVPKDEEFSITVPATIKVKQGAETTVAVTLNRGAYFKRDVHLDIQAEGINISPASILVKASESPRVTLQVVIAQEAALGEYRVSVTGTPVSGEPTTAVFTVTVVAP